MSGEDWSGPEMVRAINRLTAALEHFEEGVEDTFKGLDSKYVPREVHDAVVARIDGRLDSLLADREHSRSWARELVAPTITGLVVGVLLLVAGLVVH